MIKNGVPYDKAFAMDEADMLAHLIVFADFEGKQFDWNRMRWKETD